MSHAVETRAQIALQNGVTEAALDRANPALAAASGAGWTALRGGAHVLIPAH